MELGEGLGKRNEGINGKIRCSLSVSNLWKNRNLLKLEICSVLEDKVISVWNLKFL